MKCHICRLKVRGVAAVACALVAIAVGLVLLTGPNRPTLPAWGLLHRCDPGGTEQERADFLASNGWEVPDAEPTSREVTIPAQFDELYEQYNALQQTQGFDLQKLAGTTVTEYTYPVSNCPGHPEAAAHLLVYEGRIVGGDLSSMEQDGFLLPVKANGG